MTENQGFRDGHETVDETMVERILGERLQGHISLPEQAVRACLCEYKLLLVFHACAFNF